MAADEEVVLSQRDEGLARQRYQEADTQLTRLGYGGLRGPFEFYTCAGCSLVGDCRFAFDEYCTEGDCLADK